MKLVWKVVAPIIAFSALTVNAAAAPIGSPLEVKSYESLAATLDTFWVLIAATLVLMMQIGFMLLEAGSVRTKNAISVAQKNMLDFAFATIAFALVGFGIAFGAAGSWLPIGTAPGMFLLEGIDGQNAAFFIFQVMFCGTAATILSGAVAERMPLRAYILICIVMAAVIYPVFAHWAWGSALTASSGAILANAGFVDFAGSTVVHATGGWLALAACLVIGERKGRFVDGAPMRIGGHSAVLSSSGALFLFVGWIGFNGGSTLAANSEVPGIILNTVLAGAAGGVVGYGLMWFGGVMLPERAVNGMIGGLVAVTAGCHIVDPAGALILGAVGALCANAANYLLETRFRIDDAVGAIGVHGVAGIVGTLGLALIAPVEALPTGSRGDQLLVQAAGSGLNFVWAFGLGLVVILAIRTFVRLRVTSDEETTGLNAVEHGARLGTDHIQAALEAIIHSDSSEGKKLELEPGDENEHLTTMLNNLMDKLQFAGNERLSALGQAETRNLQAFGEIASEAIFLVHKGRIRTANAAAAMLYATDVEQLVGRPVADLFPADLKERMADWLLSGDEEVQSASVVDNGGKQVSVELRFRKVELGGHDVTVLRMTDVSEREEARNRIYHLALHDTLTDLPNRELFNLRLHEALTKQKKGCFTALLIIDLDRFKDINDLHGHPSGDTLLVAVAERLLSNVRPSDTVVRLGGDEFAVVYTNIAFPNQALDLAHRILQSIAAPLALPTGSIIHPRASIGLALSPLDAEDAEKLICNADMALYSVKNRGRNGYTRYEPEMGRLLRMRQELEADLSFAIERGELTLHYQPRIDLRTGEVASFEALIRWQRGDQLIPPGDFISIAEDTGLIISIGAWVIEEACKAAAEELDGGSISVNVSVKQFQDPSLLETISRALETNCLHPSRLELEVTESVLIDDDRLALQTLSKLRDMGVRIALDDFGTGYSSLSYLTRFKFDSIKIDRSFIQAEDENTWHIIRSVLSMSQGLNTAVVAEGVETSAQWDRLAAEGCDEIQGYYVSHPLPAKEAVIALQKVVLSSARNMVA